MKKTYKKIESINGNVICVKALEITYGELAIVHSAYRTSLAEVIKLKNDEVYLQVYQGTKGVSTEDSVEFLGHGMKVSFSPYLIGRIFDGKGDPRDGGSPLMDNMIPVKTPVVNPYKRRIPRNPIFTGLPMIDVFNTLVESQKIPIFTIAGEPYNELLARIASQAQVDIVVLGGIGLRYSDYLYFKDTLGENGTLLKTVCFIHTASDSTVEAILVPDLCLSVAESFALQGKKVLVLLNDMTNFANALKEMAITMEQVPSNRSYPGDLYSQLAMRYEKAVDFEGKGSITTVAVTTMPGDDVTHPVPDNTGYITEGQYYLKNHQLEPFGSLSRLKQMVNGKTRDDHRVLMDAMIRLYASYKETVEKRSMGFAMSSFDNKLLKYGALFEKNMMQLDLNLTLEEALNLGWKMLGECFNPEETGIKTDLIKKYWVNYGQG